MVDKNDSLLREVDEELRRERLEKLWSKYGNYVLAVAGLFVLAVGGYKFMDARARAAAEAGGAQFEAAQELATAGKTDEASKAFEEIAASGKTGYADLAELNVASALIKAGKPKDALAAFEKLAGRAGVDPLIKGFAQLQAAALSSSDVDFTELKNRLTPLMADKSPWRAAATELLGTAAIKVGKLDEARAALAPLLTDQRLPRTASERIKTAMSAIAALETSGGAKVPDGAIQKAPDAAAGSPGDKPAEDKKK